MFAALILVSTSLAALLAIWLGYPAFVWLIAHIRRERRNHQLNASATVSVILATRDAIPAVAERVENLQNTEFPRENLQLIVSVDATAPEPPSQYARTAPHVTFVQGDQPGGKACALNSAVRAAHGDILVFADTGQRFDSATISTLAAALHTGPYAAVSGSLTLGGSGTPVHAYWALEKWLRKYEAQWHSSIGVTGAVYAMRRELWEPLPSGTLLDDVYVPMSLVLRGHRVGFEPAARAWDIRAFGAAAESNRKTRTLSGLSQLHSLLPDLLSPRKNPVWLQYVCHKLLRLTTPFWLLLLVVGGAVAMVQALIQWPAVVGGVFAGTAIMTLAVARLRQLIAKLIIWNFRLQRSIIMALLNGARGRYNVWTSAK